jgi:hypothetical protein
LPFLFRHFSIFQQQVRRPLKLLLDRGYKNVLPGQTNNSPNLEPLSRAIAALHLHPQQLMTSFLLCALNFFFVCGIFFLFSDQIWNF